MAKRRALERHLPGSDWLIGASIDTFGTSQKPAVVMEGMLCSWATSSRTIGSVIGRDGDNSGGRRQGEINCG